MIGNNRLGASAYVDAKPAIVQAAERSWKWYETEIASRGIKREEGIRFVEKITEEQSLLLKEYRDTRAWKQRYSSWNEACRAMGYTKQWINKGIAQLPNIDPSLLEDDQKPTETPKSLNTKTQVETSFHPKSSKPKQEPCQPTNGESEELTEKPPTDASGCVIPQKLLALRNRRQEITDLEHKASVLHALFVKLQSDHDPLFNHLVATGQVQTFAAGAGSMRYALAECSPDVVCPQCNGSSGKCHICHGTGWISQVRWNRDWVKSHDTTKAAVVRQRNGGA